MTPVFCCGFECGQIGTVGQHWTIGAGTPTISTTTFRTGLRALRINPTAAQWRVNHPALASTSRWVGRVYLRFATLPNANANLIETSPALGPMVFFQQSDSKLYAAISGTTLGATGVAVTTGVWYRIDFDFLIGGASNDTCDVQVDGVACGQASAAAATPAVTEIHLGAEGASITADLFFDDLILSHTAADYPIGAGAGWCGVPTADGTHNVAGAADFRRGGTSTDITNLTTDAYLLIDDVPLDDTAPDTDDHIRIVAPANVTDYVECVFGPASGFSVPTTAPQAVEIIAEVFAAGTGASDEIIRINDNGTLDILYDGTGVAGITTGTYKRKFYALAPTGGAWVIGGGGNGDFTDLRVRYGYATDANPDKSLMCIMIEADIAEVAAVPPQPPPFLIVKRPRRQADRQWLLN